MMVVGSVMAVVVETVDYDLQSIVIIKGCAPFPSLMAALVI